MSRTAGEATLPEGCQLVFVGYDASTGEFAAVEIVHGGWENSRFAPAKLKRRATKGKRKTKRAGAGKGLDQIAKSVVGLQRVPAPSPPDEVRLMGSVSDLEPSLDMDVDVPTPSRGPPTGGGKRGQITVYSAAQRRRLRERLWAVSPSLLPRRLPGGRIHYPASFVGLTYPGKDGWDDRFLDPHLCKDHLRAFWRRLERKHPGVWAIWVLELQARRDTSLPPAWHFHLVLHWPDAQGETRRGWRKRNGWLSEHWARVVAGVPCPDPAHFRLGVRSSRVTRVDTLRRYVLKGGSKVSLVDWQRYGAPFWPSEDEARLFEQRVEGVEHAVRELVINTNQGAWWRILGRPAYQRSCSVFACELQPEVAVRVEAAVAVSWREHFARRGEEVKYSLPRWISGQHAIRALRAAGVTAQQLLHASAGGDVVDVTTGNVVGLPELD